MRHTSAFVCEDIHAKDWHDSTFPGDGGNDGRKEAREILPRTGALPMYSLLPVQQEVKNNLLPVWQDVKNYV